MSLRRAFIRDGDSTTTGGEVRPPPNTNMLGTPPRYRCYEGDPVYCPACESTGVTRCVPPFRPYTGSDGRQANLDGDLCVCRCAEPPRLKALVSDNTMTFEDHEIAGMGGASGWLSYAGHTQPITRFDQFFQVLDKSTAQPATGFSYAIKTSAGEHQDTLYTDGTTAKAYAQEAKDLELSYLVQTEMGVRS